ncbi:MAG: non-canonical purine NTP pyrophosphatase, RdgB/HAM1 family [Magnetovibrio sp.]|nr:non-canonical purine NTP pyrophosphatase, RdgB/HAM1 family [Magnetovibrio sp.]|tara:strand:+ start:2852 stop:3457 length:606 start_codon:yes stop_codon:yes gene_type:complete
MARIFKEDKLVIASHNPGKVLEIKNLLLPFKTDVISAINLGLSEPVEDGQTFKANAKIKAQAAAFASGLPALADDSGLSVHALNNEPGIYSARWAGANKDFNQAMKKIQQRLKNFDDKRAHFTCALALCWPDCHTEIFEGKVYGHLVWPPRGNKGFGYDPIFVSDGMSISFAEMNPEAKHAISHRAEAFKKLVKACFKQTL